MTFVMTFLPLSLQKTTLKFVSTTFLLVCFVCLKESKWKNVFYFTSKALFVVEIITFYLKYSNVMMPSNAEVGNMKNILQNKWIL